MKVQHFVSISGGKDSTATACLAIERAERRGFEPRFLFADTGNEHDVTIEHVAYLARTLGVTIETVRADFTDRFPARRAAIARDWPNELRCKQHTKACRAACEADLGWAEKVAFREACDCPIKISPPVPDHLIARAIELMQPTGNPFLDMVMLHGRFPGSQTRFCTTELKLEPMAAVKDPIRMGGTPIIEWVGERADESKARALKPALELQRCAVRAPAVIYRPIHGLTARETFAIAKRHGLKPNPLYLMGMGRVGCFCVLATKTEVRETANRLSEVIPRIREWEKLASKVSRRGRTTFFSAPTVPGNPEDGTRAHIDAVVDWSRTGRGGRAYDLLFHIEATAPISERHRCSSHYGLCE